MSWKDKINRKFEQEERARQEEKRKEQREYELREQKKQEEAQKYLREVFGPKFQCHICHTPAKKIGTYKEDDSGWWNDYAMASITKYTWDYPDDHKKCSSCEQWTCEKHLYRGVCKKCAEKL